MITEEEEEEEEEDGMEGNDNAGNRSKHSKKGMIHNFLAILAVFQPRQHMNGND